ncbi:MAG: YitT family protein [Clostridia bacterium]|nr:YitT family protein [Clostridia bacterium]
MAFGLYEIHSFSGVTEGGVLGASLLLKNTFSLSPAVTSFIMNAVCYFIGFKILGKKFLVYSGIGALSFSLAYSLVENTEPLFDLSPYPLAAAIIGALFIGVGAGLSVRAGGAPSGDDALAMALSRKLKLKIETVYLVSDLTVLALSLTYIPIKKILFSLLSVILSGKIIGIVERFKRK